MRAAVVIVAAAAVGAAGCSDGERVDLEFRAAPGSRARYEIAVDSTVVTELAGPVEETHEDIALTAEQLVLDRSGRAVELRITMAREGERPRVFEVLLDTGRGLAEVEAVEGLPVEALGELGPSRLILLAGGLLPDHPVRLGERWDIERRLDLPEGRLSAPALTGTGRLESLRVEDGVEGRVALARVRATTSLPVDRTLTLPGGRARLTGVEHTTAALDYGVGDGTVHAARSVTTGRFGLTVTPPDGGDRGALRGTLDVRVESRTTRVPARSAGG